MRLGIVFALIASAMWSASAAAQSVPQTHVSEAHLAVVPGGMQTLFVTAVDLAGNPFVEASVAATVHYGNHSQKLRFPRTDRAGKSSLTFRTLTDHAGVKAVVEVTVGNGLLTETASTAFSLGTSTSHASPARSRATSARPSSLVIVGRPVPTTVTAPNPAWVAVFARTASGTTARGARLQLTSSFAEGTVHEFATADASGFASVRIDTSNVKRTQTVQITVSVTWGKDHGNAQTSMTVLAPAPTPPPSSSRSSSRLTPTSVPTPTSAPTPTVTPTPTFVPTSTPQPTDAPTQTPTATFVPTPTDTLVPTPTASPTSTVPPTATSTPVPTPTATVVPQCPGSQQGCIQYTLDLINQDRTQYSLWPLGLNQLQSDGNPTGTPPCMGSYGHSVHMAQQGYISHDDFPADICNLQQLGAAENVGQCSTGNEKQDLICINDLMMSEPYTSGCTGNHKCDLLTTKYPEVGVGIYYNGSTWLTEDFVP